MFIFALLIGIYSYIIFALGIFGLLYKNVVIGITILFWSGVFWRYRKGLLCHFQLLAMTKGWRKNKLLFLFAFLFILQAGVNLIGTLGPELAFDALWYHLTLPKLWLINHSIEFIPGGLLYYSAMPKLAETLYVAGLSFGNEITVKMIHFSFGLLTCFTIYKLSRSFFTPVISLIAVVIFYSNLVVAWESVTAYVDLVRAFFEVMALWGYIVWSKTQKRKWLVWSAIMLGLAITTKLLALGSLVIFSVLLFLKSWRRLLHFVRNDVINILLFITIVLAVPMPWFVFSYINTGNPVYPFFSEIYPVAVSPVSLSGFVEDVWMLLTQASDPLSFVYLVSLPLVVWMFWKKKIAGMNPIGIYSLLALVVWYFTPRTGGGRFILPYLPAFSILCAAVLHEVLQNKKQYGVYLGRVLVFIVIGASLFSISYRMAANSKYLPVIFGIQTKEEFLVNNLNFSFGDFYDTDGYFKKTIQPTDTLLLYGFHNLYYVDFPFIDISWRKPDDKFNYIATQNTMLDKQFNNWILVYENEQTMVKLYTAPERMYSKK